MAKKTLVGSEFYRGNGLEKAITVHVSKGDHAKLEELAKADERSLQVLVRRILQQYLERQSHRPASKK